LLLKKLVRNSTEKSFQIAKLILAEKRNGLQISYFLQRSKYDGHLNQYYHIIIF